MTKETDRDETEEDFEERADREIHEMQAMEKPGESMGLTLKQFREKVAEVGEMTD